MKNRIPAKEQLEELNKMIECPECQAEQDPLYGWHPIIKMAQLFDREEYMLKRQCFACGFMRATWISLDWTPEERETAGLAFQSIQELTKEVVGG